MQKTPTDPVLSDSTSFEDKGLPHRKQSLHGLMTSIYQYVPKRKIVLCLIFPPLGEDVEDEMSILESLRHNYCVKRLLLLSPAVNNWRQEGFEEVFVVANT